MSENLFNLGISRRKNGIHTHTHTCNNIHNIRMRRYLLKVQNGMAVKSDSKRYEIREKKNSNSTNYRMITVILKMIATTLERINIQ